MTHTRSLVATAAIGGVTALGAATAAVDPARRAVLGGGDSLPDSSRLMGVAFTVLAGAAVPFVATWHSVLGLVRQRAGRAWRGLPDAAEFDRDGQLVSDFADRDAPSLVEQTSTATSAWGPRRA